MGEFALNSCGAPFALHAREKKESGTGEDVRLVTDPPMSVPQAEHGPQLLEEFKGSDVSSLWVIVAPGMIGTLSSFSIRDRERALDLSRINNRRPTPIHMPVDSSNRGPEKRLMSGSILGSNSDQSTHARLRAGLCSRLATELPLGMGVGDITKGLQRVWGNRAPKYS